MKVQLYNTNVRYMVECQYQYIYNTNKVNHNEEEGDDNNR
jgi:hypothetical protein